MDASLDFLCHITNSFFVSQALEFFLLFSEYPQSASLCQLVGEALEGASSKPDPGPALGGRSQPGQADMKSATSNGLQGCAGDHECEAQDLTFSRGQGNHLWGPDLKLKFVGLGT